MSEPRQKPGRSKQDYGTPPELLTARQAQLIAEGWPLRVVRSPENPLKAVGAMHVIELRPGDGIHLSSGPVAGESIEDFDAACRRQARRLRK